MKNKQYIKKPDPLGDKSFDLAMKIISIYKDLQLKKNEFNLSQQLFQSGTNPGSLIREARSAKSNSDFIYKLNMAQKSCQETIYWLELLYKSNYVKKEAYTEINNLTIEVLKMLTSSIKTKKRNIKY